MSVGRKDSQELGRSINPLHKLTDEAEAEVLEGLMLNGARKAPSPNRSFKKPPITSCWERREYVRSQRQDTPT